MGAGGQRHDPAALHPRITRYPLHMWLDGHQCLSGRVQKISPPPGFFFLSRYFPLIHFVLLNPSVLLHVTYDPCYRPYTTLTTDRHPCPRRDFFFVCPGFFPFDPFLYCLNPFSSVMSLFTFHATVLIQQTQQTDIHAPRRDSNPQSQQASGRRPTPETARPLGSADPIPGPSSP
jgi:hypothetical protein